jgi:hypothetical protein
MRIKNIKIEPSTNEFLSSLIILSISPKGINITQCKSLSNNPIPPASTSTKESPPPISTPKKSSPSYLRAKLPMISSTLRANSIQLKMTLEIPPNPERTRPTEFSHRLVSSKSATHPITCSLKLSSRSSTKRPKRKLSSSKTAIKPNSSSGTRILHL